MDANKRKRKAADGALSSKAKRRTTKTAEASPFDWQSATMMPSKGPPLLIEPAKGCRFPDDLQFLVYTRRLDLSEIPKDPTPLDKVEYMLYSNAHPVFDFKAREDHLASRKRVFVGYENPRTGEKQMVQTKKLIVRAIPKAVQAPESAMREPGATTLNAAQRIELGQEFGNKKIKKAIESKARNELALPVLDKDGKLKKLDKAEAAILDEIGEATAGMATQGQLEAAAAAAKPIPRADLSATVIQDVYKPSVFIGNDILDSIYVADWIAAVQDDENVELSSKFVATRLVSVARGPDKTSRLRILRYLLYLIIYWSTSKWKAKKFRVAPLRKEFMATSGASEEISLHLLNKFTDGSGGIAKFYESMLLTHILVLAAIIDNYQLEMADLRMDLKVSQEVLTKHFAELGGKVKELKNKEQIRHVARLSMPLQFPRMRIPRVQRR